MDFSFLRFLAEPWFVIPWYAVGIAGAAWVVYDGLHINTPLNSPLKAAWPIIIFFFSIVGIALYLSTARPPRIGGMPEDRKKERFHQYAGNTFRKVTGAAIHCVGGDGLGIVSAMVAARILNWAFWTEFWVEYAVGFAFGWFIFQYWSMRKMTDSGLMALWMGGRAEFFSMITVMVGMGAVMWAVTPAVVGEQPDPGTYAFWGFAALGLMVGMVLTYPTNWALVKIGWKHGMH
ncbi:DUF4396 domain-containing protein [Azospirillum sp. ST 5-10]|uniref:DUF4396 domain-containing protein n=1 Tax=unclassified Azospirillum TaxID=2630922 RepID=UPI003F4A754C